MLNNELGCDKINDFDSKDVSLQHLSLRENMHDVLASRSMIATVDLNLERNSFNRLKFVQDIK